MVFILIVAKNDSNLTDIVTIYDSTAIELLFLTMSGSVFTQKTKYSNRHLRFLPDFFCHHFSCTLCKCEIFNVFWYNELSVYSIKDYFVTNIGYEIVFIIF